MKKILNICMMVITIIALNSCEEKDTSEFIAQEATDFTFSTSFLENYLLNNSLGNNLAERFTWRDANFGIPTERTYELQAATMEDFSDYTNDPDDSNYKAYNLGTNIGGNEIPATVKQFLALAKIAGLDNDPETPAPNTGKLYFRVRATIGKDNLESFSAIQALNIELQEGEEEVGGPNCPSWWVVGAGAPDAGWNWDNPIEFLCTDQIYTSNINLANDSFRFFTEKDNWDSGLNFPYFVDEGYSIDPNFENAMDGDENFRFIGTPGKYSLTIDSVNKTIKLGPPAAEDPNCDSVWVVGAGAVDAGWNWDSPIEFFCTDNVYSTNIKLTNDAFRFFLEEGNWDSGQNYPFYANDGYTIDSLLEDAQDGDNNFKFNGTPGTYLLTVDTVNKTITLGIPRPEEPNCDSVWVVGAGAVDAGWNWDSPIEFTCTDNVYSASINLTNDAFRFFLEEGNWDSGQNYPFYADDGYTIDTLLEDAQDGDNNFKFNGTPGIYYFTVDTVNKIIDLRQ
ncbi:SusF/SusE family outer membrane protein [Tamlana fucoidanivorans]|uniref:SusF/SusE family outer membrane protein n=1 Tax=Allotamlana fucoidanivorans TaxID=2583814 RepID=A0A5C4SP93_9FLAO|nr:SusF/SusE family outer membrane protein [Tamlana fucoidanivorans]TNJ45214.1 SusF/SusE family outer membrane protein [Tamlana fucoidanivorans]